ncbi:hypothetical protein CICLE_v10013681mg [Citrus x clementina]|uniref:F-box protein CPR1 n=2 Tax=Citrus TaxID=2706 RepID=A0ACB8K6V7_CITSI|nr:hypothetical protein CICLE_v10013681mg [Citrus x clementina]KAH9739735.1 F-box protein CPR1 [Citrus sinensis]
MASLMLLTLDVIIDVLILLPLKSLQRFRCASKSFHSIIDGQDFVKLHLNRSLETNSNLSLIILPFFGRTSFYSLSSGSLDCGSKINLPAYFRRRHDVVSSCNGLLALKNYPKGSIQICGSEPSLHGFGPFGYDVGCDDYKLDRVIVFKKPEYHTEVTVYSLKTTDTEGMEHLLMGALHWLANQNQDAKRNNLILAFNLKSDRFYQVPTPFADVGLGRMLSGLLVLNRCLSLLCQYQQQDWDLRVMKEYGVKDSWTTVFKYSYCDSVIPLAYSRTWDKVLLEMHGSNLCWYNIVTLEV